MGIANRAELISESIPNKYVAAIIVEFLGFGMDAMQGLNPGYPTTGLDGFRYAIKYPVYEAANGVLPPREITITAKEKASLRVIQARITKAGPVFEVGPAFYKIYPNWRSNFAEAY